MSAYLQSLTGWSMETNFSYSSYPETVSFLGCVYTFLGTHFSHNFSPVRVYPFLFELVILWLPPASMPQPQVQMGNCCIVGFVVYGPEVKVCFQNPESLSISLMAL